MRATFVAVLDSAIASAVVAAPAVEKRGNNGRITYYSGSMLKAPACGGSAPTDDDFIAAVSKDSPFKCGDEVNLWRHNKHVKVKVVDECATCTFGHWFDLSKAAFKELAELELGELDDVVYWK